MPRASDFNSVVTLDLKDIRKLYMFWMVCVFTRMMKGVVLKDKKVEIVIESLHSG